MLKVRIRTHLYATEVRRAVEQASIDAVRAAALLVEAEMKRLLNTGGGRAHEPSQPGEPPHKQTGNLANAVTHAVVAKKSGGYTALIGPGSRLASYGKVHEHGGRNHPPRPFAVPALHLIRPKILKEFKNLKLARTQAGRWLNSKKGKKHE